MCPWTTADGKPVRRCENRSPRDAGKAASFTRNFGFCFQTRWCFCACLGHITNPKLALKLILFPALSVANTLATKESSMTLATRLGSGFRWSRVTK